MAEATMTAGSMPPQLPPGPSAAAGNGAAGTLPLSAPNGVVNPAAMTPGAIAGVGSGMVAVRAKFDEFVKQPTVRRALPAILGLLLLIAVVAIFQASQTTNYRAIMPGMTESDKQAAIE
ncbi:MAG: hypothetical protein WBJ21_02005, partial [Burkholderiaceae bacterium]